jgi:hypothetical protein
MTDKVYDMTDDNAEDEYYDENPEEVQDDGYYEDVDNGDANGGDDYGDYDYNNTGKEEPSGEQTETPNILSQNSSILEFQEKLINQATTALEITPHLARALLNNCKWNVERLKDRFWDD